MKFKKIIKCSLATALVFGCATTLSGCKEENVPNVNLTKIIDKNIPEDTNVTTNETIEYINNNKSVVDNTKILRDYSNYGLLVLETELNFVGFYSLHYQKYLIEPQSRSELTSYDVYTDENVGYFIKTNRKGTYTIYDSLGNILYNSTKNVDVETTNVINNEIYATISDGINNNYYKYMSDGKISSVVQLPTETTTPSDEEETLNRGDTFVTSEKIDLKDYGVKDRYLINSGKTYSILNKSNTILKSFNIPANAENVYLVGNSLIYQTFVVDSLNPQIADQTLSKTHSINLAKLEQNELDLSYIILNISKIKDEKGIYKYGIATIIKQNNGKFETNSSIVLIDSQGRILEDLTKFKEPKAFIKIGENYYNTSTKIIYSNKLKEIVHLKDINPIHIEEEQLFVGTENGKYGAVDYTGKVVIPFIYDSLNPLDNEINFKNGYIIAKKGYHYYQIDKSNGATTNLGEYVEKVSEDLYMVVDTTYNEIKFISQDKTYKTLTSDDIETLDHITTTPTFNKIIMNPLLGEYVITKIQTSENENHYIAHSIKDLANASIFETIKVGTSGLYQDGERVMSWYEITQQYSQAFTSDGKIVSSTGSYNNYLSLLTGKLIIDSSIVEIAPYAFSNCYNLTEIEFPNTINSIGEYAFYNCDGLTNITLPYGITIIKNKTFYDCSKLTNITIPNSVITIGDYAFQNCMELTDINIPSSVTSIGKNTFYTCPKLSNITVNSNNTVYSSKDGVLFNKNQTKLILYPINKSGTSYIVPSSVTTIGESAFEKNNKLTNIILPNNLTTIEIFAFANCDNLTVITIPDTVTNIPGSIFLSCDNLSTIYLDTVIYKLNYSNIFDYATKVYVKSTLEVTDLTDLIDNFTKQDSSDNPDYNLYTKNS